MEEKFRQFKRYVNRILRIIIILCSSIVIFLSYPNTGSFKYEFHKGNPWKHENLMAPFDFAIYKTDKDINKEKIEILKNYKPYFIYNDTIGDYNIKAFTAEFQKQWTNFARQNSTEEYPDELQSIRQSSLKVCKSLFKQIYEIGILDSGNTEIVSDEISIVKNKISEITKFNTVFTSVSAYNYFINTSKEKINNKAVYSFVKNLNINAYLYPNLIFDKQKSEQLKKQLIENISLTKGVVQSGERIIMKGDIVDDYKYQIIISLKTEYEKYTGESGKRQLNLLGRLVIIFSCLFILYLFLLNFRKRVFFNNKKMIFIFMSITLISILSAYVSKIPFINIYIVPIVIIPIIINSFTDSKTALASLVATALIIGYIVPNSYEFVFIHLTAGCIAVYSLNKLHRRGQLILTVFFTFITYSLIYVAFSITQETDYSNINWYKIAWIAGNCFLLTLSYPFIYLFEKMFGFISDTTLIELSNPNHPLLRELTKKAPGTFQHSLQVANLAEEAIYKIGGNPLLVRTGALYHDIGKMYDPVYFIENQQPDTVNPHNSLEFNESAKIVTDHVKRGIKLAKKHNLPDQIIHFIVTHHGEGKAMYFYNSYKNKYPDKEIDDEDFTYPGPNPFSKETAVLMMADAVEASCRSLKEKSTENIKNLINEIINKQIEEGKFNNADITFKDIDTIKKTFIYMVININHGRIAYPKDNKADNTPNK